MHARNQHFVVIVLWVFLVSNLANATVGFQPPVTYPAGSAPVAVAIGDFNGDGKPDLAVANHGDPSTGDDGSVSIFIGNGDGTFQAASNILVGKNPQSLAIGDFNTDGKIDLAVLNGDDTVSVSIGNGDGTFQGRVDYATSTGPLALSLGDVNGDLRPDLIVLQAGSGTGNSGSVGILLGDANGTFQNRTDHSTGSDPKGLAVFDVNGDGKSDVVMTAGFVGVETMLGNGDGTFQAGIDCSCGAHDFNPNIAVSAATLIGGADFNGDGRTDIVVGFLRLDISDPHKPKHSLYEEGFVGNGDGTFDPIWIRGSSLAAAIADLDQDGHSDLALVDTGVLVALFGHGDATFQTVSFGRDLDHPTSVIAADLNGDKFPDLIVLSAISVLLNTARELPVLSVSLSGNGSGTVTGDLGIGCPVACSAPFDTGVVVSLTAAPSAGSTFTGWGGACSGTGACNVTMNTDQPVTATFILTPEFSMSASAAAPDPISPGQSSSARVDIGAVNGFNGSVSLVCSVQPAPAQKPECSVNPASIAPGTPATLTVTTTAPTMALVSPSRHSSRFYATWLLVFSFALTGIGVGSRRVRKKWLGFLLCSLLFTGLLFQAACGGGSAVGGGRPGTPTGQYTITVTGASGSLQHSTTVVFAVQ